MRTEVGRAPGAPDLRPGGHCSPVWLTALLVLWALTPAGPVLAQGPGAGGDYKLGFDPTLIGDDGLYGPPDGLRALDYEFCIPATAAAKMEVSAIGPSARFHAMSPGRIGCGAGQVLVLGNSHQPGFRELLRRLAELPYVQRIEQAWFE